MIVDFEKALTSAAQGIASGYSLSENEDFEKTGFSLATICRAPYEDRLVLGSSMAIKLARMLRNIRTDISAEQLAPDILDKVSGFLGKEYSVFVGGGVYINIELTPAGLKARLARPDGDLSGILSFFESSKQLVIPASDEKLDRRCEEKLAARSLSSSFSSSMRSCRTGEEMVFLSMIFLAMQEPDPQFVVQGWEGSMNPLWSKRTFSELLGNGCMKIETIERNGKNAPSKKIASIKLLEILSQCVEECVVGFEVLMLESLIQKRPEIFMKVVLRLMGAFWDCWYDPFLRVSLQGGRQDMYTDRIQSLKEQLVIIDKELSLVLSFFLKYGYLSDHRSN